MGVTLVERLLAEGITVPTDDFVRAIGGRTPTNKIKLFNVDAFGNLITTINSGGNTDTALRTRVAIPILIFSNAQIVEKETFLFVEELLSGATSTFTTNQGLVSLTLPVASGARAIRQTRYYIPSLRGRPLLVLASGVLGTSKTNVRQRIGYFDSNNGFFFEQTSTGLVVVRRTFTSGSAVDTSVAQASWNVDTFGGLGPSGITIDMSKFQNFVIDFDWLGRTRMGFLLADQILYCHTFDTANVLTVPSTSTPRLPVRFEIENTGLAASPTELKQSGVAVFTESGEWADSGITTSANTGVVTRTIAAGTPEPIIAIRLKSTHNRGLIVPQIFSTITTTASKVLLTEIFVGGALIGGAFVSASAGVEVNTTATAYTGGTKIASQFGLDLVNNDIVTTLWAAANFAGVTDMIVIMVGPFTGTASLGGSLGWREFV